MDLSLLTPEELEWVNSYHSNCRDVLAPYMDEHEMAWLRRATEPVRSQITQPPYPYGLALIFINHIINEFLHWKMILVDNINNGKMVVTL